MDSDLDFDPAENEDPDFRPLKRKRYSKSIISSSKQKLAKTMKSEGSSSVKVQDKLINDTSLPIVYQCSLCYRQIPWRNKLKKHVKSCFKTNPTPQKLNSSNFKIRTGVRFRCEYCLFMTTSLDILLDHKTNEHFEVIESGLIECSHCNFSFFTIGECRQHMMEQHKNDNITNSSSGKEIIVSKDEDADINTSDSKEQINGSFKSHPHYHNKNLHPCPVDSCSALLPAMWILERHIQKGHNFKRKFNDIPRVYLTDDDLLFCIQCGHKTTAKFPMQVHRLLYHMIRTSPIWRCPKRCFQTPDKFELMKHVQEVHNLNEEDFTHHLLLNQGPIKDFGELKIMDKEFKDQSLIKKLWKWKWYNCHFCESSTKLEASLLEHEKQNHCRQQCDFCEKKIQGEFQMFWHNYVDHGNATNYDDWLLQCTICTNKDLAKKSYQHGGTHAKPVVKFKTIFQGEVKGIVYLLYAFEHYTKNAKWDKQHFYKTEEQLEDYEDSSACVLDSAIKVLDWTTSDNDEPVVTKFLATDNEAEELISNEDSDELAATDNEFYSECGSGFSCKNCKFKTTQELNFNIHQQICNRKNIDELSFFCLQPDCKFMSQYRHSLKRHLIKMHEINIKDIECVELTPERELVEEKKLNQNKLFTCEKCSFSAKNQPMVDMHTFLLHSTWQRTEDDPFRCPQKNCGLTSMTKTNFKRHIMRVHNKKLSELGIIEIGRSLGVRMYKAPGLSDRTIIDLNYKGPKLSGRGGTLIFKKNVLKRMENIQYSANKVSEADISNSKDLFECLESNCLAKFHNQSDYTNHYFKHTDFHLFWRSSFSCPFEGCLNECNKRLPFKKKHLIRYHQISDSAVKKWGGIEKFIDQFAKVYKCLKCNFQGEDMKELKEHFRDKHWTLEQKKKAGKFNSNFLKLKCTECTFETNKKVNAYFHGLRHYKQLGKRTLVFHKYINLEQQSDLVYNYPKKNVLKCSICDFTAVSKRDLLRHQMNIHKNNSLKTQKQLRIGNIRITKHRTARREELRQKANNYKTTENTEDVDDKQEVTTNIEHSKENSCQIIEVDQISETIINDALENLLDTEENDEVIKIEFTDDSSEGNNDENIELNPFTGELIIKDNDENNLDNNEDINKSICYLCEKQFPNRKTLKTHVYSEHILTEKPKLIKKPRLSLGKVPDNIKGKISYVCHICNQALFNTGSLHNHTNVHAKAANDFNLKVTFTKLKGQTKLHNVTIVANPDYVPRKSGYVRWNPKRTPKDKPPVLDFDPTKPIFSCDECNFKTNENEKLTKHKKLHWNKEKEEMYKTQNWFTCAVCFYYCFDAERLKEHSKIHEKRANWSLNVEKTGKDSWFFGRANFS